MSGLDHRAIAAVFDACFRASHATVLVGGFAEPEYLPGSPLSHLRYREDFAASALHEAAHWCIAGAERRRLRDFGYWYEPDGRDAATQERFQAVEARNQGLERCFCEAAGVAFRPSTDNLGGAPVDVAAFAAAVEAAWRQRQQQGLPRRAACFAAALARARAAG